MNRLIALTTHVSVLPGAVNVGYVAGPGGRSLVVDTGLGTRAARRVLGLLAQHGHHLEAILLTHTHGDHTGGNALLVDETGAVVHAPAGEIAALDTPLVGTMSLFCGAYPIAELRGPRHYPLPCPGEHRRLAAGVVQVAGLDVEVAPLPGHSLDHKGYLVDDVFFVGDALIPQDAIDAGLIAYTHNVADALGALDTIVQHACSWAVPGHGSVIAGADVAPLVAANRARMLEVLDAILDAVARVPLRADDVLAHVCRHFGIDLRIANNYYQMVTTIHAYLGVLHEQGKVGLALTDNELRWFAAKEG